MRVAVHDTENEGTGVEPARGRRRTGTRMRSEGTGLHNGSTDSRGRTARAHPFCRLDPRTGYLMDARFETLRTMVSAGTKRELLAKLDERGDGVDERIVECLLAICGTDRHRIQVLVLGMARALWDTEPGVRAGAAGSLCLIGDRRPDLLRCIVPDLACATRDETSEVRANALEALGSVGERWPLLVRSVVPDIAAALKDEDSVVREVAANVLGIIGARCPIAIRVARQVLVDALNDTDPTVREAASEDIALLGM